MLPRSDAPTASVSFAPPRLRRWVWLTLIALGLVILVAWATRVMGLRDLMERAISELRHLGAPIFFSGMAILPALGFPLMPFALAAGPVFSPILGTGGVVACAILAVGLNVSLSYALASTLFRPPVQRLISRLGYHLPDPHRHNAWLLTLLVRVTPGPPFWLQSYALGLVRVPFGAYVVVSTVVPAGYLSGAILFGDAMFRGKSGAAFFAAGLLILVGTGLYFLRRKLAAKSASQSSPSRPAPSLKPLA